MTVWNDAKIMDWIEGGGVEPYDMKNVNPASLDLRWSGAYRIAGKDGWSDIYHVDELEMHRGDFFLLDSLEFVKMPPNAVGKLFLKSSAGRMGIEHLHAGYVDCEFSGTLTFEVEIRVPWSVTLLKHQRLMQLTLEGMSGFPINRYPDVGRYQNQSTPTPSKGLP